MTIWTRNLFDGNSCGSSGSGGGGDGDVYRDIESPWIVLQHVKIESRAGAIYHKNQRIFGFKRCLFSMCGQISNDASFQAK